LTITIILPLFFFFGNHAHQYIVAFVSISNDYQHYLVIYANQTKNKKDSDDRLFFNVYPPFIIFSPEAIR